ncbi:serine/threonine-protein kinase [Streptomyces litmocidini]|uniref:serine/threonine-protein kinase n=1 Tax=Streptomyces litmocidini TaxID=67318 RepID=UPI00227D85FA|nr:serine/threonine-protein kinase [Streptomyces litmocidini]
MSNNGSEQAGHELIGGRYRLGERLGQGGMGVVRRATDELLGRPVAVKTLALDSGADPAGALREARVVAQIRHPHVIVVHDVVEHDGLPALVMELVDGGSLADRLAAGEVLSPREAARLGLDLLDALSAAHARDVLHRDVKPANVLLEKDTGRAVLTDFGIASLPGATTLSRTGVFIGTPEYTAPERMRGGDAGPASDLWSLGALLCAAATGTSPFRRDSIGAVLHAIVYEEIRPSERMGPLVPVVRGLLERDPARRLGAAEARRMLAACAAGEEPRPVAHAPTARETDPPAPGRSTRASDTATAGDPGAGRRGGKAVPVVAAVVAVCVAAATVAVLRAVQGDPATGAPPAGRGSASATSAPGQNAPATSAPGQNAPAATAPATASGPTPTSAPSGPGGHLSREVTDERGFSVVVPYGARRTTDGDRVFYTSEDGAVRVGIRIRPIPSGGAIGVMRSSDASGPTDYPGYRDARVEETTHRGLPAARWEFTWNGFTSAEGPRHTEDICWERDGTLYDLWVSAPVDRPEEARIRFGEALDSFRTTGG